MRLQSRSAYRVFEIVQDIRELAEALGHPKFVLVAHDWGAVAAWQFAAYHQVHAQHQAGSCPEVCCAAVKSSC